MTLKHMRIFRTVCQTGSITLAAKKLYMTQPAVSLAIREMEEYYGVKLFDRLSRRLYITPSGRALLEKCTQILELNDQLEIQVRNAEQTGTIRVGASMTLGSFFLPQCIRRFSDLFENTTVEAIVNSSKVLESMLEENELDLCLIEGPVHNDRNHVEALAQDELWVICHRDHPLASKKYVTLEELYNQKLLVREKNSGTREIIDSVFLLHNIHLKPLWQSTSTTALLNAVKEDLGVTIVPGQFARHAAKYESLCRLEVKDASFIRKFNLVYKENKHLSAPLQAFIECVKQQLIKED